MYKVRYFLSGGTLVSKLFPTLTEAVHFCVYKVGFMQTHEIYKVDEYERTMG